MKTKNDFDTGHKKQLKFLTEFNYCLNEGSSDPLRSPGLFLWGYAKQR